MALLNRFLDYSQKKKEASEDTLWQSYSNNAERAVVRVILLRECEKKGKKLLFDSQAVDRQPLQDEETHSQFTEVNDGYGFTYLSPPQDVKMLSEMILGSVAMSHQQANMKIHLLGGGEVLWSSILQAPRITRGSQSSDSSLGSSFGCSLGSFPASEAEDFSLYPFPELLERDSSTSGSDSGFSNRFPSFSSVFSDIAGDRSSKRRLSSNADMPDYGSLCSLQRRCQAALDPASSLLNMGDVTRSVGASVASQVNFQISPNSSYQQGEARPRSGSEVGGQVLKQGGKNSLLGMGLVIRPPTPALAHVLFAANAILEDIFNHMVHTVQQAYTQKKRFVVSMFGGYLEAQRMVERLFLVPRLHSPAWHLCLRERGVGGIHERLVSDICSLKRSLDTKETNFFLSALLTGVLSNHLGWVSTVMPGSSKGENLLQKPQARGFEQLRQEQWYSCSKMQYRELHGMLGNPVRAAKSLVVSDRDDLAKTLVFVLSYFIRCSMVFRHTFAELAGDWDSLNYEPMLLIDGTLVHASCKQPFPNMSSSSPASMEKSSSLVNNLATLDLLDKSSNQLATQVVTASSQSSEYPVRRSGVQDVKVGFVVGSSDESPPAAPRAASKSPLDRDGDAHTSAAPDGSSIIKGEGSGSLPSELEELPVTLVPVSPPDLLHSVPADVPSMICCSSDYLAGCVLQSCHPAAAPPWRSCLQADLLAMGANSQVSALTEECVCVVGDIQKLEVSLVSAQQVVVGRPGLPVPMSPLVATILDSFTCLADRGTMPAHVLLNYLEDQLQVVYLHSCVLAEYLLSTEFTSLQTVTRDLDLDPSDIPLLLAVCSTHTPAVGRKFCLGFSS